MKKTIVVLVLLLVPMFAFAQFSIGPTALYNFALSADEVADEVEEYEINASDFTLGADARLSLGLLRGGAMALYTPGDEFSYPFVELYPTVGLGLDILIATAYAGVGPGLGFVIYDDEAEASEPMNFGGVLLLSGGLNLGGIQVLANFLTDFSFDTAEASSYGYFGVSLLFTL